MDDSTSPSTRSAYPLHIARRSVTGLQACGLDDLHFHDLRHEATPRLAARFDTADLAKVTGHRDINMLMCYYHPRGEDLAKALYDDDPPPTELTRPADPAWSSRHPSLACHCAGWHPGLECGKTLRPGGLP